MLLKNFPMNKQIVSSKNTRVSHTPASAASTIVTTVVLFALTVLHLEKGRVTVRCTRDKDTQTRVNQSLKALGFVERVEAFVNENEHYLRLMRGRLVANVLPFPAWNSSECWMEFAFTPTVKSK